MNIIHNFKNSSGRKFECAFLKHTKRYFGEYDN